MGPISTPQVEELRDALQRHGVTYLFIGNTGAILHGFPDTTQDADLYVQKTLRNGTAAVRALHDLGFTLTPQQTAEIRRGKRCHRQRSTSSVAIPAPRQPRSPAAQPTRRTQGRHAPRPS